MKLCQARRVLILVLIFIYILREIFLITKLTRVLKSFQLKKPFVTLSTYEVSVVFGDVVRRIEGNLC